MSPVALARLDLPAAALRAALVCWDAEQRSGGKPWPMSAGLLAQALDGERGTTEKRAMRRLQDCGVIEQVQPPPRTEPGLYRFSL